MEMPMIALLHLCGGAGLRCVVCVAQLLKNETLKITYSYWDGQGHRRVATVKKGDTVKEFLQKVKEQLIPEFRELRCRPPLPPHEQGFLHTRPSCMGQLR